MPFVSRLWNMRQAVQRGYEALYTLQVTRELKQLVKRMDEFNFYPVATVNPQSPLTLSPTFVPYSNPDQAISCRFINLVLFISMTLYIFSNQRTGIESLTIVPHGTPRSIC